MSAKQSLGNKSPAKVIEYLRHIGDNEAADSLQAAGGAGQSLTLSWGKQVWGHTGILVGYIPADAKDQMVPIENGFALAPDPGLKDSRIRITLERFWVQNYPGLGTHKILCEFMGKNQIEGEPEELRYVLSTEARDGASASISGIPIFLGATVGKNGIAFEGKTINVSSGTDDDILAALNSGPFRDGLGLLTMAQPALKPFVSLASSFVNAVLKRSQNKQIYHFKLGLDFSNSQTSAALRYGSFAVVQIDDAGWNWENYRWNASAQQIVKAATGEALEFNYLVFRVSPYDE